MDDFGQIRDLATKVLTRHGYRVLAAASGEEALAVADSHRDHIDLLLTDVMMTGISGPELAERIVTVKPGIKVLYMSGYPGDQLQNRFSVNGPDWFIAKPFTPAELAGKVRQVLETPARP